MSEPKDIVIKTQLPLAPFTTFHIGGPARVFIEAHTEEEVEKARGEAARRALPLMLLGNGSNLLVPDAGVEGVVLKMALRDSTFEDRGDEVLLIGGAGLAWDAVVDAAIAHGVFGIENLAGIPGTLGGASVQNIGAYGASFADAFEYADTIDRVTGARARITHAEAGFGYRTSRFKETCSLIITRVALRLSRRAELNLAYPDLARAQEAGVPLTTLAEVAGAVRAIRAKKFPQTLEEGTAGSFFKNPVVPQGVAAALGARYPGLPVFPHEEGSAKLSLAWILDNVLSLKGYAVGRVRLYERQPLVMVARAGALASEVETLACTVEEKVRATTGIVIEREVETFCAH